MVRIVIASIVLFVFTSTIAVAQEPPASTQATTVPVALDTPATMPGSGVPEQKESGVTQYFANHVKAHDPIFFLWGPDDPQIKFQISLKFQLFTFPEDSWTKYINGFYFGYTQQSLWDISGQSSPFYDTSYKPEMLYYMEKPLKDSGLITYMTLQAGAQHESNGKNDPDSRSLNVLYFRPAIRLGETEKISVEIAPTVWYYVGNLEDNPDIADYRGYGNLRAKVTFYKDLAIAAILDMGDDWDNFTAQVDVTYPISKIPGLKALHFDTYLQLQYFTGYGESLLDYNEKSDAIRLGFGFVR